MIARIHLTPIILIAGLLWLALLFISGVAVEIAWLSNLVPVVPILLVALAVFDRWGWRWSWLNGWFADRPVLIGTWRATLQPYGSGEPVHGWMVVRQTFSTLSMRLLTSESASRLVADRILLASDGMFRVVGVYANHPKLSIRDRSQIHYGGLLLDVHGLPPQSLEGHYWTDRGSRGTIVLTDRTSALFSRFEDAKRALEDCRKSKS
jgi:hypothetical protein